MKYNILNQTDLSISHICLGTMTFGMQNTVEDAFNQLDMALDYGVNFIDTAELYSVPAIDLKTFGETERQIGAWLKTQNNRDKLVITTKVLGPTTYESRPNPTPLTSETIMNALDKSLERLNIDYIDLYQIHWPMRKTNYFGRLGYLHTEDDFNIELQILNTIQTMDSLIKSGKIRYYGLSNETAWGTMTFIRIAKEHNLASPVSVQNPYNLLNRTYEVGLAEVSMRENVGLLAYGSLGGGTLSGKHMGGIQKNTRFSLYPEYFGRYTNEQCNKAVIEYNNIAKDFGLTLTQMALAFINQQLFIASNIIGCTTTEQLHECLNSSGVVLSPECIQKIEDTHTIYTYPAP